MKFLNKHKHRLSQIGIGLLVLSVFAIDAYLTINSLVIPTEYTGFISVFDGYWNTISWEPIYPTLLIQLVKLTTIDATLAILISREIIVACTLFCIYGATVRLTKSRALGVAAIFLVLFSASFGVVKLVLLRNLMGMLFTAFAYYCVAYYVSLSEKTAVHERTVWLVGVIFAGIAAILSHITGLLFFSLLMLGLNIFILLERRGKERWVTLLTLNGIPITIVSIYVAIKVATLPASTKAGSLLTRAAESIGILYTYFGSDTELEFSIQRVKAFLFETQLPYSETYSLWILFILLLLLFVDSIRKKQSRQWVPFAFSGLLALIIFQSFQLFNYEINFEERIGIMFAILLPLILIGTIRMLVPHKVAVLLSIAACGLFLNNANADRLLLDYRFLEQVSETRFERKPDAIDLTQYVDEDHEIVYYTGNGYLSREYDQRYIKNDDFLKAKTPKGAYKAIRRHNAESPEQQIQFVYIYTPLHTITATDGEQVTLDYSIVCNTKFFTPIRQIHDELGTIAAFAVNNEKQEDGERIVEDCPQFQFMGYDHVRTTGEETIYLNIEHAFVYFAENDVWRLANDGVSVDVTNPFVTTIDVAVDQFTPTKLYGLFPRYRYITSRDIDIQTVTWFENEDTYLVLGNTTEHLHKTNRMRLYAFDQRNITSLITLLTLLILAAYGTHAYVTAPTQEQKNERNLDPEFILSMSLTLLFLYLLLRQL